MSVTAYLVFAAASVALILLPGPNVALIVGTSLSQGRRAGLATVAGTSSASVLQLGAISLGLALLLTAASHVFAIVRWIGVAYLVVLGLRAWRAPPTRIEPSVRAGPGVAAFARGFLVSLTNPKTLLFYGAFLPQFIDRRGDAAAQMLLLSATFLVIALVLDCTWVMMAWRLRGILGLRPRLRNRVTGGLLIGAAAGLALTRDAG